MAALPDGLAPRPTARRRRRRCRAGAAREHRQDEGHGRQPAPGGPCASSPSRRAAYGRAASATRRATGLRLRESCEKTGLAHDIREIHPLRRCTTVRRLRCHSRRPEGARVGDSCACRQVGPQHAARAQEGDRDDATGRRAGRSGRPGRRPPSIAGHQAGAEALARLPVELRGRVQLHQRLDRDVHPHRPRPRASAGRRSSGRGRWSSSASSSWPSTSPSSPATSRSPARSTSGRSGSRNRTLGWFTGWFYFWAGVLTTTAVAITVPLVLSSILGRRRHAEFGPFTWNVWVAPRHPGDHDPDQRASASGCCRSSTTSASPPRSWACSSSPADPAHLLQPPAAVAS